MKSNSVVKGTDRSRPVTRTERRAKERGEKRQRGKRNRYGSRSGTMNLIAGGLTILAVLAIVIYGVSRSNSTQTAPRGLADAADLSPVSSLLRVGQPAPNFTLRDAGGTAYTLAAQRGHPVLLEFFAVWCPVCQGEAPVMARLTKEYAPRGVRVWSVLANPYGKNYEDSGRSDLSLATRHDLSWYAKTFNVRHPQLIDPKFGTVNQYGVNGYPGIYVVNGKGVITFASAGHEGFLRLSMELDKALGSMNMSTGR